MKAVGALFQTITPLNLIEFHGSLIPWQCNNLFSAKRIY